MGTSNLDHSDAVCEKYLYWLHDDHEYLKIDRPVG